MTASTASSPNFLAQRSVPAVNSWDVYDFPLASDLREWMSAARRSNVFTSLIFVSRAIGLEAPSLSARTASSRRDSVKRRLQECDKKLKNSTSAKALADVVELIEVAVPDC